MDKISGTPITTNGTIFLLTSPIELKAYLNNWRQIGFKLQSYRLDIIESDEQFDNVMEWTKSENVQVLVDPFFDKSSKLLKGSVIEDLQEINKSKQNDEEEEDVDQFSLLFTILNEDGTYTQLFRDFVNDITLLLNDKCSSGDCRCMACQMYDARIHLYGNEDLDIRQVNENTWVLNLSDGETEWEEKFLVENSVPWEEWEHLFFADDKVGAASPLR